MARMAMECCLIDVVVEPVMPRQLKNNTHEMSPEML